MFIHTCAYQEIKFKQLPISGTTDVRHFVRSRLCSAFLYYQVKLAASHGHIARRHARQQVQLLCRLLEYCVAIEAEQVSCIEQGEVDTISCGGSRWNRPKGSKKTAGSRKQNASLSMDSAVLLKARKRNTWMSRQRKMCEVSDEVRCLRDMPRTAGRNGF